MAAFNYRFQNLLNIKRSMEEQEKLRFAEAKNRLFRENEMLENLIERREKYREISVKARMNSLSVRELRESKYALDRIEEQIKQQEQRVAEAQKSVDEATARLQNAMKERKMHEKLKEKAIEAFLAEENAAESKTTDEMVSYVYSEKKE